VTTLGLCERYPLKPWTVRSYCSQGRIPHLKIGRKVYFRMEDIEAWLDEHTRPALWRSAPGGAT
jgi:excisionase family DNA binding protein